MQDLLETAIPLGDQQRVGDSALHENDMIPTTQTEAQEILLYIVHIPTHVLQPVHSLEYNIYQVIDGNEELHNCEQMCIYI